MDMRMTRQTVAGLVTILLIAGCLIDAGAQRRRRHRKRHPSAPRIMNPAINLPSDSSANSGDSTASSNSQPNSSEKANDPEELRRTIRSLSSQVDKLNEKLSQVEESQRSMVDLERLTRAEQRSEGL